MQKRSFGAGVVTGIALVGATAFAAGLRPWTRQAIDDANAVFHDRSGLRFGFVDPPEPERPQTLHVHAAPVGGLRQVIAVTSNPPDRDLPPDPCFRAVLGNPPEPDRPNVVLHVLHPDQFAIVDANGAALQLVPATPIDGK